VICTKKFRKFELLVLFLIRATLGISSVSAFSSGNIETPASITKTVARLDKAEDATTLEDLFEDDSVSAKPQKYFKQTSTWRGFSQFELAHAYDDPEHLSKMRLRSELSNLGQLSQHVKWKISGRIDYDAVYDISNFYPRSVREDQRFEFLLRENYLDISKGDWDFRIGRQHIIWGEMVGLFFADVISAKDMREFVLPDFDILRIPQWAVRTEYSKNDFHADLIWIPFATIDKIGRPGAEFYPLVYPPTATFVDEDRSKRNPANSNYGIRLSQLINGWDISAFYYHSLDASPTFYLVGGTSDQPVFQPRHDKIDQIGWTVTKDLGPAVLKGEFVYTNGRQFNVKRLSQLDGLVHQDVIDYALGIDFHLPADVRMNLQFIQRVFLAYDRDIFADKWENGASILLHGKFWRDFEAQTLLIHSLNRSEFMLRPRLTWNFARNWRMAVGGDMFSGPPTGLFGRFANNDRIYTEFRFSF
jgi:hypothetical protein